MRLYLKGKECIIYQANSSICCVHLYLRVVIFCLIITGVIIIILCQPFHQHQETTNFLQKLIPLMQLFLHLLLLHLLLIVQTVFFSLLLLPPEIFLICFWYFMWTRFCPDCRKKCWVLARMRILHWHPRRLHFQLLFPLIMGMNLLPLKISLFNDLFKIRTKIHSKVPTATLPSLSILITAAFTGHLASRRIHATIVRTELRKDILYAESQRLSSRFSSSSNSMPTRIKECCYQCRN